MTHFKCASCGNESDAEAAPECCGVPMQESVAEAPVEQPTDDSTEEPAAESSEEEKPQE
jgi:hypothetical protein